ncbi:MAG: primosomal replication protein N [Rugosibacter sp.]|nr:primosomal replication protein N [Rugosibacter sp.]MDO9273425.1 primosomal replication protein N [Rugosibacter sp.]
MSINLAQLSGYLQERGALRRTPAGIPVLEFSLAHESIQIESEVERKVHCEMNCVAIGSQAQLLATIKPGDELKVSGFLAARSLKRRMPILHVNTIEFVEGNKNGI